MINKAPDVVVDRGLGCFVGLAIGDALGTALEFERRDARPVVTELVGGGPFDLQPGEWTDDTSTALCLADSLIAQNDLVQDDLMQRFLRWYELGENSVNGSCFDIGGTTRAALALYRSTGNPEAGSDDARSAGNGSIMRLAPIALRWYHDRVLAIEKARGQSRTTHAAPEAVEGCAFLAEILVDAIRTGDKATVLHDRAAISPGIDGIARGSWRAKSRDEIESSGYVVHTLEAALWAVGASKSFAEALILAANLAGDADTVAAVTGQIAGALWGLSAIPEQWLEALAWRREIEARGRHLLAAAVASQSASFADPGPIG